MNSESTKSSSGLSIDLDVLIKPDDSNNSILTIRDIYKFSKEQSLKVKYEDIKKAIESKNIKLVNSSSSKKILKKYAEYHNITDFKNKSISSFIEGFMLMKA